MVWTFLETSKSPHSPAKFVLFSFSDTSPFPGKFVRYKLSWNQESSYSPEKFVWSRKIHIFVTYWRFIVFRKVHTIETFVEFRNLKFLKTINSKYFKLFLKKYGFWNAENPEFSKFTCFKILEFRNLRNYEISNFIIREY